MLSVTSKAHLIPIYFTFFLGPCLSEKHCQIGWFGPNCQHMCHCLRFCYPDGECDGGCARGWFGPKCQYEDIAMRAILSPDTDERLIDGDDRTCNTNNESSGIQMFWNSRYPVVWIRITVHKRDVTIDDRKVVIFGSRTMDIHFTRILVHDLEMHGDAVPHICSVYITGGRNVAIKQRVTQSSIYSDVMCDETCSLPENAVDGNRNPNLYSKSCTHTQIEKVPPSWKLVFNIPSYVNRYVLYNRDVHLYRLSKFQISVDTSSGKRLIHDDTTGINAIYTVLDINTTEAVSSVVIRAMDKSKILTICEAEMYGDSQCPQGFYGLDCDRRCNCRNQTEQCLVSTGGCVSGCNDGFIGSGCLVECDATYFGKDCQERCSTSCLDQLCTLTDGECFECLPGRTGNLCQDVCLNGTFGTHCQESCSRSCARGRCNPVTGACTFGCVDGYIGDKCNDYCNSLKYGTDCQFACSPYCHESTNMTAVSICHHSNGVCLHGCLPGYDGLQCTHECVANYYGDQCRQRCSSDCLNNLCHHIDGRCLACPPGKSGHFCQIGACGETYYGDHCEHRCSPNCLDRICNESNGLCIECPAGRAGEWCLEGCPPTFYGHGCKLKCIRGCFDQLCHSVTGHCLDCPQGRNGSHCEFDSIDTRPEKSKHIEILVAGLVAAVLTTVIVVVFLRKRISQLLRWTKFSFKYARKRESSDTEMGNSLFGDETVQERDSSPVD